MFFSALSACSISFFFYFDASRAVFDDMMAMVLFVGIPLALTLGSFFMIHIGKNMQKGKSARAGGILVTLFGALLVVMGITVPFMKPTVYPAPGWLEYSNERDVVNMILGFGSLLCVWGYRLLLGESVEDAQYVFQPSDPTKYAESKGLFGIALLVSAPLVFLMFYFFMDW